jgi:hypothetical protein
MLTARENSASIRPILVIAVVVILLAVMAAGVFTFWPVLPHDLPFQVKNKDFANYWMASRLTLDGKAAILFGDPSVYQDALKSIFGPDYPWHNWSYPPHTLLMLAPLGFLDYLPALTIFLGVTLSLFILSLGALRIRWTPIDVLLLLPFIVTNLVATQNGFLTAALMVGGLGLRAERPVLSGILFGLMTFKPQIGVVIPVLLIAERQWRVIIAATVTAILLVALSAMLFGMRDWVDYVTIVLPYQGEVMRTLGGDFPFIMASAFGSGRSLGFDASTAMWIHLPFAVFGALIFLYGLLRLENPRSRGQLMLLASFLIMPYSTAYDLGAVVAMLILTPAKETDLGRSSNALRRGLVIVMAILPILMLPLGKAGYPITPIVFAAAALLVVRQGRRRPKSGQEKTPPGLNA